MADNANVVNPAANDQTPAQTPSAVQTLLASINQPMPAAPQAPAPTPVQANTSKWSGLVQGALLGLAGGLKAGLQNSNTAGTRDFRPVNGFAMGEQEDQNALDRQQQVQQEQNAQAQQNFDNQLKTGQYTQEQILNRARLAESNLNAYKTALAIDQAPQEAQDAYNKAQNAHVAILEKDGMAQRHAEFPDLTSAMAWMKQTGHSLADTVFTHQRGPHGTDKITAWENPDAPVDAVTANTALKPYGVTVPAGSTMRYGDFHSLLGKSMSSFADQQNKLALQKLRDQDAMQRAKFTASQKGSGSGGQGSVAPADLVQAKNIVHGLVYSGQTLDKVPGFAKVKPVVESLLATEYPQINAESVHLTGEQRKRRDLAVNATNNLDHIQDILTRRPELFGELNGRLSQGRLFAGTDDPDLAALQTFADNTALALTGAHSIRSSEARAEAKKVLLNFMHNGPQGLAASIAANKDSLKDFADLGKPRDMQGNLIKPIYAVNAKTKQRISSIDGGKTWQPAQ